jgi:hypothetical protein
MNPKREPRTSTKAKSDWTALLHTSVILAPVIIFTSLFIWFSENRISPNPAVEASAANPVGLLTSNFVYDGSINVENIIASSIFLLIICLYYPRELRLSMVYLLPVVAVVAGALAELTAISSPYVSLPLCNQSCSFYGMSGVASAMVGFTFASFFISFGLVILQGMNRKFAIQGSTLIQKTTGLSQAILVSSFATYVVLLLIFSGLIRLPTHPSAHPGQGNSTSIPPPAILTQTPPVALVHSASLVYGFLLCLAAFVLLNRRYHILVSPVRQNQTR